MTTGNLELVVGALLPVLVTLLKREHFPDIYNAIIALVVYVVVGVAAVAITGSSFDINNIVPSVAQFTAEGTFAYQLFWKNLEGALAPVSQASPVPPPN